MYPELLKHIKTYISITTGEEKLIADNFTFVKLKKRDFLLEPGKICKGNCFVVKGCMRMYFINNKLTEQITHFGLENWWIADYDSLVNQKPSVYYMQAVEPCELLLLPPKNQALLLKEIPQLETYFRIMFEKAAIASQRRIHFISGMSDEERYRDFSRLFPWFMQRVPQYMVASYLGFTPQFLSRIRAKKA